MSQSRAQKYECVQAHLQMQSKVRADDPPPSKYMEAALRRATWSTDELIKMDDKFREAMILAGYEPIENSS